MNPEAIKRTAERLQEVAESLIASGHKEVEPFIASLRPLLEMAIGQRVVTPVAWREVPGSWLMSETALREHTELESAYAEFKIEVTGGESPALRRLRESMRKQ